MVDPDPAISQAPAQRHHGARRERLQTEPRIDVVHEIVPGSADIGQCEVAGQLGRVRRLQLAPRLQLLESPILCAAAELQGLQAAQKCFDTLAVGGQCLSHFRRKALRRRIEHLAQEAIGFGAPILQRPGLITQHIPGKTHSVACDVA